MWLTSASEWLVVGQISKKAFRQPVAGNHTIIGIVPRHPRFVNCGRVTNKRLANFF
jgi:hypothetical protein